MQIAQNDWGQLTRQDIKMVTLFDRDWSDLPFVRANLMSGRIRPSFYNGIYQGFLANVFDPHPVAHLVLNCLIEPELSLERKKVTGQGIKGYRNVM